MVEQTACNTEKEIDVRDFVTLLFHYTPRVGQEFIIRLQWQCLEGTGAGGQVSEASFPILLNL